MMFPFIVDDEGRVTLNGLSKLVEWTARNADAMLEGIIADLGVDPAEPRSTDADAERSAGGSRADDGRRERQFVGALAYRVRGFAPL